MPAMPKIPTLERFACFEVKQGVLYASIVLIILWILEAISVFFSGTVGGIVWGLIWALVGLAVYGLVVVCIQKDKPRTYLLPALFVSAFNVVVGCINAVIFFFSLAWFSAIILCIMAGLTAYYFLGLYTLYQSQAAPAGNVEPA